MTIVREGGQQERRQFGRRKTCKPAILSYADPDGEHHIDCVVVDISAGGARVSSSEIDRLPEKIQLKIPEDDFAVNCRRIYVKDGYMGLQFISPPWRPSWIKSTRGRLERMGLQRAISRARS